MEWGIPARAQKSDGVSRKRSPTRHWRALVLAACFGGMLTPAAQAQDAELTLEAATREALDANLELAARVRNLAADEREIDLARSALLPGIQLGAQGQILDDERSDGLRGSSQEKSLTFTAKLSQVLYDETDWARLGIQKHVYAAQAAQLESFRLGIAAEAAIAYLELKLASSILDVQEQNRVLTESNLETSRARVAAGWSSEREMLRWQSQLAGNDSDIVQARTQVLNARFELNRVRNRAAEASISSTEASVERYGFMYARQGIAEAVATPEGDRQLRDLLVRVGIARSPQLTAIDEALAAEERLLVSNERSFWVPSLNFGAGVNHSAVDSNSSADFQQTEWGVGAALEFPLLEGGAKFATLSQTRDSLSALRTERRAIAQNLDQTIRAALAGATGAYLNIGIARRQENVARQSYHLANESYVLGVSSILSLLDAQNQLLVGTIGVTKATYAFLEALIRVEQAIALFPFLEPEAEMSRLLDRLEAEVSAGP